MNRKHSSEDGTSEDLPIKFVGRKSPSEVKGYLKKAMVLVLPSLEGKGEGMPNVILEAMSMGIPVIASRVAGVPEMIEHGKTGYLVEPGDPDGIAKYLKKLIDNPKLRKRFGRNCLHEIKKYDWKRVIPKLEEIYEEVKM